MLWEGVDFSVRKDRTLVDRNLKSAECHIGTVYTHRYSSDVGGQCTAGGPGAPTKGGQGGHGYTREGSREAYTREEAGGQETQKRHLLEGQRPPYQACKACFMRKG